MTTTVITLTRNRPTKLKRAIQSVQQQHLDVPVKHLIMIDDCPQTLTMLEHEYRALETLKWKFVERDAQCFSGPKRCAQLRNLAVQQSDADWIAFLDDDNLWERNHLLSLLAKAQASKSRAVHSYRKLLYENGDPYLESYFPWCRDQREAQDLYQQYVKLGIFVPGDCIVRDQVDQQAGIQMVDTGEWLLSRVLLLNIPFPEAYTQQDEHSVITEDDKFLDALVRYDERIACTQKPTLLYYLGGYSNNFAHDTAVKWF